MSGQATGWVLRYGPRDRAMRAVLVTIADAANRDGKQSHPGIAAMVEGSLYSRRHVITIVGRLIDEGWITETDPGGGRGRAATYDIPGVLEYPLGMGALTAPIPSPAKPQRVQSQHVKGAVSALKGAVPPPVTSSDSAPTVYTTEENNNNESRVAAGAPDAPLPGLDPPDHARTLCDLFADSLGRRGKRPVVTAAWLTDMDLLLRVDGREPDKVRAVITWLESGADDVASFWRPNIRSPRKLRSKWDQMQEQYQRARAASAPGPAAPPPAREQVMTDRSVSGRWTPTQTR